MVFNLIENKINICFIGKKGLGKTFLLKKLSEKYKKEIIQAPITIKTLNKILKKKYYTKQEAYNELFNIKKELFFIDDIDLMRKNEIIKIIKLSRENTIICTSQKKIELLKYDFKTIEIPKKNYDQSMRIALKYVPKKIAKKIVKKSKGIPLLIIKNCEYYNTTGRIDYYKEPIKIDSKTLIIIAYLLLTIRFIPRLMNNWKTYTIIGSIAYGIFALTRIMKRIE